MSEDTSAPVLKNVGERGDSWKSPWTNFTVLFQHRFLVRNLVRKEIRGRYRNAMLGYTWAVLEPAMLASVYYFLFIMLAGNADKMYPVWVILGIIVWSCFGKALQGTVSSLSRNGQTIHLVYFPRIIFPMTAVQGNIIISMMSCFVVLPIMMVFDLPVTIYLLYVPLSILMAGFLAIGLGMLVAPLNCAHRDIEHLFRFIVRAGFFLSPVMWTYEMALERGAFGEMVLYNPMVVPLTMIRHGIAGESIGIPWAGILWSLGFGIVMWVLGSYVFNRHEAGAVKHL
ncbi:ABC transporter permease [Euryarchaeota archaeon]|nr:ABC transporter permease [Euryarchaeota archaeon]MDB2560275.1 ABC transporter permease [Euryarchaeota archaeon]